MVLNRFLSSFKKTIRQDGGALVEFAIALPVCILIIFGVFELGRLLAQYSWVQQTSYNSAFLGSGFTLTSPQTEPNYVATELYNQNNRVARNAMNQNPTIDINNSTASSITVRVDGAMNLLTNLYPLGVDISSYSVRFSQNISLGNTLSFENFSDQNGPFYFHCAGEPCGPDPACSPDVC
jgi:hypothetical protein